MRARSAVLLLCVLAAGGDLFAQRLARRRAVLVGIDDYSSSHLHARPHAEPVPGRDWPDLSGAVEDVREMAEMLTLLFGFDRRDIVTLTDQEATREAILSAIEHHLVAGASKGDVVFFYFAGHGSQVRNSRSDEPDLLDESFVPADSRLGARDIRDKEFRALFNRILDRGAHLTVMFDSCHSGSGARGLATGQRPRGVAPDLRDVADGSDAGPRPENRGALVLSASRDFDTAWQTRDESGKFHGAFTWAWLQTLREAPAGESAGDTFLRARARLHAARPFQEPVIAGGDAQLKPFLGGRRDRRGERMVVAVQKVMRDGTVIVEGGWANGLSIGSELAIVGGSSALRLEITALRGLGKAEARAQPGRAMPKAIHPGALLEVVGWAAPQGRLLRVWMPRVPDGFESIAALARKLMSAAATRGIRWVANPIDATPTHVLRQSPNGWELLAPRGEIRHPGSDAAAIAALAAIPAGSSLFVQLPAPAALAKGIAGNLVMKSDGDPDGVQAAERPEEADYILVGRYSSRHLEYAWIRPLVARSDRRATALPLQTAWVGKVAGDGALREVVAPLREVVAPLREAVLRLRRILAWNLLQSPPDARFPYHLVIRRARNGQEAEDVVIGGESYGLALRKRTPSVPARLQPRYIYVFVIDSHGKSVLLFPTSGSIENRFPLPPEPGHPAPYPPPEIALGRAASFRISAPYGVDTYFLLTTDEPLANPWILEWDGVRTREPRPLSTPLERLLALVDANVRGESPPTPANWSIERIVCESVAPRASKNHTAPTPPTSESRVSHE